MNLTGIIHIKSRQLINIVRKVSYEMSIKTESWLDRAG